MKTTINDNLKWNIKDIYNNEDKLEEDYKRCNNLLNLIISYKETLGKSAKNLLNCLNYYSELNATIEKISIYFKLRMYENNLHEENKKYKLKMNYLNGVINDTIAFIKPSIIEIGKNTIEKFYVESKELKLYENFINKLFLQNENSLSTDEKNTLRMVNYFANEFDLIFQVLNEFDLNFPEIRNIDGEIIKLDSLRYISLLENQNRNLRRNAYIKMYNMISNYKYTLSQLFIANIKKHIFFSKINKYVSTLEYHITLDELKPEYYSTLINTITSNLKLFHKYLDIKKEFLNISEMNTYDLFVPFSEYDSEKISFEDMFEYIIESLEPLGDIFVENYKQIKKYNWFDISKEITSKSFILNIYKIHPFIHFDYTGNITDVFELTRIMGYAFHKIVSDKEQIYIHSEPQFMMAEVTSTVNELLIIYYLIENNTSEKNKLYLINYLLNKFHGNLFKQVLLADFEKTVYENCEKSLSMSFESINKTFHRITNKYYGGKVNFDEKMDFEWIKIKNFYNPFSFYKYAITFLISVTIVNKLLNKDKNIAINYLNMMKSGSSLSVDDLLKKLEINLSKPDYIKEALLQFDSILEKLISLLKE
jgi:oligoendopeptidase F